MQTLFKTQNPCEEMSGVCVLILSCVCVCGPPLVLQAFLRLSRQGEALHEDLSVQSTDGQKVRLLRIDKV